MMRQLKIKNVLSVVLFGSVANGQNDLNSDLDIMVIVEREESEVAVKRKLIKNKLVGDNDSMSLNIYTHVSVNKMKLSGSLLLWHLKRDGKLIYGQKYFNDLMKTLPSYNNHKQEYLYFNNIYSDMVTTYEKLKYENVFDLSLMFTIVRNTCILLTDLNADTKFGRNECFIEVKNMYSDFPITNEIYENLFKYKLLYTRGKKDIELANLKKDYLNALLSLNNMFNYTQDLI